MTLLLCCCSSRSIQRMIRTPLIFVCLWKQRGETFWCSLKWKKRLCSSWNKWVWEKVFLRRERKKCKKILSRTFKSNSSRPQGKKWFRFARAGIWEERRERYFCLHGSGNWTKRDEIAATYLDLPVKSSNKPNSMFARLDCRCRRRRRRWRRYWRRQSRLSHPMRSPKMKSRLT